MTGSTDSLRFQEARYAFGHAKELPRAERQHFLQQLAEKNAPLAEEVSASVAAWEDANKRSGTKVGPFTLGERIGRGGMGQVYRAVRRDGQVEQEVAIKLLGSGWVDDSSRQRFLTECQVLSHLQHPGIAHMIDAGALENGMPYLVMEYVQGIPIIDYCDSTQLGVFQRLRLFSQVTEAVAYAHRKLVVHRDLKPANILVTAEGRVKIVDFGIAKPLLAEVTQTQPTHQVFSLTHAAPEQIKGEAVSVSFDIYALGVILYQLLAGQLPFPAQGRSRGQIEQDIFNRTPKPPTGIGSQGAIRGAMGRDLDSIVLQCLAKHAQQRYQTVLELQRDIQRYLAGIPVRAHYGRIGYRLAKFVRRNQWPMAVGLLIASVLGTAGALAYRQHHETLQERDRARFVTDFMVSAFEAADPTRELGGDVTAKQIVEQSLRSIEVVEVPNPRASAELLAAIVRVQMARGLYSQAEHTVQSAALLADQSGDEAMITELIYLRARLAYDANKHEETERLIELVLQRKLTDLQWLRIRLLQARLRAGTSELATAESLLLGLRQEVETRKLWGAPEAYAVESLYGSVVANLGRFDDSIAVYESLLRQQEVELHPDHPLLTQTVGNLSFAYHRAEQEERARVLAQRALGATQRLYGPESLQMAYAVNRYGVTLDDPAAVVEQVERALAITRIHRGGEHSDVAMYHFNAALNGGPVPELSKSSDAHYRSAISIAEKVWPPHHRNIHLFRVSYALFLNENNRFVDAFATAEIALAIAEDRPEYKDYQPYYMGGLARAIARYALDQTPQNAAEVTHWLSQVSDYTGSVAEMVSRQQRVLAELGFHERPEPG